MWFTDERGNKVNTENKKHGISSSQLHDKGSDVVEESIHNKDSETEGMKGNQELENGQRVQVEQGSGIDSGKIGIIVGKKPFDEFPKSSTDWYQIQVEKPEIQKGIIINVPKSRLEVLGKRITYPFDGKELSESPKGFKEIEKLWDKKILHGLEGNSIVYTNKKDPSLTVEMHTDFDEGDGEEDSGSKFWYMFPARNGKGIPNSPTVINESGGYTEKDAEKELKKLLVETSNEL